MSKIIIGIHGMGNKPEKKLLEKWWKTAILEGLKKKYWFINFQLVYWASQLHETPISLLDIEEPYIRGGRVNPVEKNMGLKKRIRDELNNRLDTILLDRDGTLNFSNLTEFFLRHFANDLNTYYKGKAENSDNTRELVCQLLAEKLYKHRNKKILLIAHSMGSIIAWDVLTKYVPDIEINTLVTIGSPLGLPFVHSRIVQDLKQNEGKNLPLLKTPENIMENWYNLSDFNDRVALSYDLKNDFLPNSRGVQPVDILVTNNYVSDKKPNHHKSYGYLRCPELSEIITVFLKVPFLLKKISPKDHP